MITGISPYRALTCLILICTLMYPAMPQWSSPIQKEDCTIDAQRGGPVLSCAQFRFFPASRELPESVPEFQELLEEPDWSRRGGTQWRFPAGPEALWLSFSIRNDQDSTIRRFLVNEFAFADSLLLIRVSGDTLEFQQQGLKQAWKKKDLDYRLPVFALELPPGTHQFLLRVEARSGKLLSLKLEEPEHAASRESLPGYLFPAFLTGAIVALFLSLFIAIIFKERTGFYYCIYVCLITAYLASWEGYARQVFFPDHGTWTLSLLTFTGALAGWSVIALWRELLILSVHAPLVDRIMKWIGRAYVLAALYSLYPDASFRILDVAVYILPALFIPLAIYSGIFVIRVGFRPALFSLIGFSGFLICIPFFFYAGMGLIPGGDLTRNPLYLGYFFEFSFFLLSVGVRIHFLHQLQEERTAKRLDTAGSREDPADATETSDQTMRAPGLDEPKTQEAKPAEPNSIQEDPAKTTAKPASRLSRLNVSALSRQLDQFMEEEKLFCDEDLTQERLADLLGISRHQFSELLRVVYGTNFYRFVNKYRIAYARELLLSDPDRSVLSVALSAGFNSKSTFNSEFKKQSGMTPIQYRRKDAPEPISSALRD